MRVSPDFIDEVIDYDDYELDEDDLFYQRNYVLVTSQSRKMFNIYEEEGISGHKPTDDIGLIVKYENGEYFSYFAVRSTDLCMSSLQVFHLVEDLPKEHEFSLLNPLNKLLIEMIHECVVLKD